MEMPFTLTTSVTKWENKKQPNFLQKWPKSSYQQFLLLNGYFSKSQNSFPNIWTTFAIKKLLPRTLQNRPIWSLCFCKNQFTTEASPSLPTFVCLQSPSFLRCSLAYSLSTYFFKNGPPWPLLSFIFGLFKQTSLQLLLQISVKKFPSSIRCRDSNPRLESPPITRPGLQPNLPTFLLELQMLHIDLT